VGQLKLLLSLRSGSKIRRAYAPKPFPLGQSRKEFEATMNPDDYQVCGPKAENGCLFNVYMDPGEEVNLALQLPDTFAEMMRLLRSTNMSSWPRLEPVNWTFKNVSFLIPNSSIYAPESIRW